MLLFKDTASRFSDCEIIYEISIGQIQFQLFTKINKLSIKVSNPLQRLLMIFGYILGMGIELFILGNCITISFVNFYTLYSTFMLGMIGIPDLFPLYYFIYLLHFIYCILYCLTWRLCIDLP